jgi:hypothetical protein
MQYIYIKSVTPLWKERGWDLAQNNAAICTFHYKCRRMNASVKNKNYDTASSQGGKKKYGRFLLQQFLGTGDRFNQDDCGAKRSALHWATEMPGFTMKMGQKKAVLWSRNYFFPLRLSESFGSGSRSGSSNSLGTTWYHRFYVKKDIFHVFNGRKST